MGVCGPAYNAVSRTGPIATRFVTHDRTYTTRYYDAVILPSKFRRDFKITYNKIQ